MNALGAEVIKYLAEGMDLGYTPGADYPGKARINSAGAQVGAALIDALAEKDTLDPDSEECRTERYLLNSL